MRNQLFIPFCCLLCSINAWGQNVNIPDANFKAALVADPAINTNVDSEIQVTEASAYAGTINVNNQGISDLTGIEAFTGITQLIVQSNDLTSVDLSANTALTYLELGFNQLSSLDVSNNTALTYLSLSGNQLTTLDISANTLLETFTCNQNNLTSLDVSANTALTYLSCTNNQLTGLDVSNNTALTTLQIYDNGTIATLDVSANTALTNLSASGNALTSIDVSNNTALTNLNVGLNQISSINVSANTALTSLSVSSNLFTSIDVSALVNLQTFQITNNMLTTLDISANTALASLYCHTNQLSTLDLTNNPALTTIYCNDNLLTSLDLSTNTALTSLYCYNNSLTSLDLSANTSLTNLDCKNNEITSLDLSSNASLSTLDCSNNRLTYLNVRNGNNTSMFDFNFNAEDNYELACIEVDDPEYSESTWNNVVFGVTFDTLCSFTPIDLVDSLYVLKASNFNSEDTYVNEADPDVNYNTEFERSILNFGGNFFETTSRAMLVKYDLTSLNSANINSNHINLYFEGLNGFMDQFDYGVYQITEMWEEDSVTWNNRPTVDSTLLYTIPGTSIPEVNGIWYDIQLPNSVVQNWVDSPAQNHGFMVIPLADSYGRPNITSSENTYNADFHHQLVINSTGVSFDGIVIDNVSTDPLEGVVVKALETSTLRIVTTDTTDASGAYFLDLRFPGTYDIRIEGINGYLPPTTSDSIVINESEQLTFDFQMEPNANAIAGNVSGTWSVAGSPYVISGETVIQTGDTLSIEPGVEVQYAGNYALLVNGTLMAVGNATDTIKFTSYDTTSYDKGRGIRFVDANQSQNTMAFCVIEDGFAENVMIGNQPEDNGGGIYISQSRVTIENCDVRRNSAFSGGGISIISNYPYYPVIIRKNLIRENLAREGSYIETGGGGIAASGYDSIWIESNIIMDNRYNGSSGPNREGGGGVRLNSGNIYFINNLVYGNYAVKGSGVLVQRQGRVYNNIIWNNSGSMNGEQLAIQIYSGESVFQPELQIHYNNIQDTLIVLDRESPAPISYTDGIGNTEADPQFIDSLSNDFHLMASSPLIDAGNSFIYDSLQNFDHFDFDDLDRLFEVNSVNDAGIGSQPLPDLGPYEYLSTNKPTALVANFIAADTVHLTWTDNNLDETGFQLERSQFKDSLFTIIDNPGVDATTSGDRFSIVTDTLYYRIRANTNDGFGSYSRGTAVNTVFNLSDSLALVAIYNATDGSNWTNNTGWVSGPISSWYGVTTTGTRVTSLELDENNLVGTIPDSLALLEALQVLDLSYNQLSGSIPANIVQLTNLTRLLLGFNQLTGNIPEMIGLLDKLELFSLSNNMLSGTIPSGIGALSSATYVSLSANQLTGNLPDSLSNLSSVEQLYLSFNQLTGQVPDGLGTITSLLNLLIQENELDHLPDLTGLPNIVSIRVNNNKFDFDDLIPNVSVLTAYSPQLPVGFEKDTLVNLSSSPMLTAEAGGTGNSYIWYKDNFAITGETAQILTLPNVDFQDEGDYYFEATNPSLPDLTLTGAPTTLKVSSLERDSLVLRQIYSETGSSDWINSSNWASGNLFSWEGITIENNRVVEVDLSNKNVVGVINDDIKDIVNLESIDLSNNQIEDIPDFSGLNSLVSLNVSGNNLGFDDLEPNISIATFEYSNQGPIGDSLDLLLPRGTDYSINFSAPGTANTYQWKRNGIELAGETETTYLIDSINFTNMGIFTVDVTSDIVSDLILTSQPLQVLATSPITITAIGENNSLIEAGSGRLLKIEEPGKPFDTVATVGPDNGKFIFDITVLGDYLVALEAEDDIYLPTYYENTFLWEEADTLRFRSELQDTMYMTIKPQDLGPDDGDYTLSGIVEEDFPEDGRIDARKRVKRAGCSVRRFRGAGRANNEAWELVAYVYTNDNGEFDINFLPAALYRFNIEYPGIPMDPESFIEFELGAGDKPRLKTELLATISESGIFVEEIPPLGIGDTQLFKIYPNPANHYLVIEFQDDHTDFEIRIIDLNGKLLYAHKNLRRLSHHTIALDRLSDGLHLLQIIDSKNKLIETRKIYIQHK